MSDVLVKGMNMPSGCLSCPFYNGDGCKATWKLFKEWQNVAVRASNCPLVEIKTPHGLLIDANELLEKVNSSETLNYYVVDLADLIREQCTAIIETKGEIT